MNGCRHLPLPGTLKAFVAFLIGCCCVQNGNGQSTSIQNFNGITSAYNETSITLELRNVFEKYDDLFLKAINQRPKLLPWLEKDRQKIMGIAKEAIAIKDEWIPEIRTTVVGRTINETFVVDQIQSTSWSNCKGAAHLYLPADYNKKQQLPVVLLACGHGDGGKLYSSYRLMAENLASNGIAVLVPDNIGQGERTAMGHYGPVGVFDCGLTVQGLIVMETVGWLNWIHKQQQFDKEKIAVAGNSGGGTLGLFLAAVAPEKFSALVCSGYPSTFEYVARKEKVHCRCNLVPGIVPKAEMWQVLGCFAPKPMFILQGNSDEFFPVDIFYETARNVGDVYYGLKAPSKLKAEVFNGLHGWDETRIRRITQYICTQFDMPWNQSLIIAKSDNTAAPKCYSQWPQDAINIDRLAEQLSGKKIRAKHLSDVFPPAFLPKDIKVEEQSPRGDYSSIFAQYEAFLGRGRELKELKN